MNARSSFCASECRKEYEVVEKGATYKERGESTSTGDEYGMAHDSGNGLSANVH